MKKILVSGATSMVGIALIEECINHNIKVTALVRKNSSRTARLPQSHLVNVIECDLKEFSMYSSPCDKDYDVFFHFGWTNTDKIGRRNVEKQIENINYSVDALKLAIRMGCKKFVGAGSQAEYGVHTEERTKPNSNLNPQDAYGICKLAAGKLCSIEAMKMGIDFSWVRIFSIFGKYEMSETLIQALIPAMLNNKSCALTEGSQNWDYLYSSDAGKAFYLIGEKVKGNNFYCLGSGKLRILRSYIEEMKTVINSQSELRFGEIPYQDSMSRGMCADITSLQESTGWNPQISFSDGIRLEAQRIKNEKMIIADSI